MMCIYEKGILCKLNGEQCSPICPGFRSGEVVEDTHINWADCPECGGSVNRIFTRIFFSNEVIHRVEDVCTSCRYSAEYDSWEELVEE